MKNFRSVLSVLLLAVVAGCSSTPDSSAPAGLEESATLWIRGGQVLHMATGGSGQGTLLLDGWQYEFIVENMAISGIGGQEVQLEGTVYNLAKAEDIEGTFKPTSVDIQQGGGPEDIWFKNEKGVVAHITSSNNEITIRLGSEGAKVTLKE